MTHPVEKLITTNRNNVRTLEGLTIQAHAGLEKMVELNLAASKAMLGELFSHAQAVLRAKDPQEWLTLQAGMLQPLAEKSASYGQHVMTIATDTGAEFTKVCEAKLAEAQTAFADTVDSIVKNAPAGTEAAMAAFKSAMNTSQTVIESAQSSAKKAVETVETNLTEVANQAVNAVGGHAKKR